MTIYKCEQRGKTYLATIEQDDPVESPLDFYSPEKHEGPLFVLEHLRYDLGHAGSLGILWDLVEKSPLYNPDWFEEEILCFNGEPVGNGRVINPCYGHFDLVTDGIITENIPIQEYLGGTSGFRWLDNPDVLEYDMYGLAEAARRVGFHVYPIYLYDHGGISISMRDAYPFNCPWDAGCVGYVVVTPEMGADDTRKYALSYVKAYDAYLTGDVWYICIFPAPAGLDTLDEKEIHDYIKYEAEPEDSCGGFYGYDYAVEALTSVFCLSDVEVLCD